MATTDKASTRDRLLDAAAELFYRDGVSIGVEALCRTAGVSKRSMYQLFASKDEVLAASLARRMPEYEAQLAPDVPDAATPRERILNVFERLEKASTEPAYQGCPFLAALVELKDPQHPASAVAREAKGWMKGYFRTHAEDGGARDPELLARQLMLVFDGASARSGARVETLDGLTVATATTLLDAAGVK
ncbi:TetR family transcriptional regulator [Streptomyces sp. WAC 01325]|uniref:TetR/AcrR family transcriptional regulator n=1 Tax=Streptomyces TaxID=1883 RepID=UPI000F86963F|nr:TetR/AcrR family transcriptional regulator [Streptomyces sp. WAC 01325]RSN02768.1 TetR family transcriptional regulator [Streptomyces sp. WAC 01325]WCH97305.1 TetR/AcrR family transcriptional regulator [Streptomyces moderatus]